MVILTLALVPAAFAAPMEDSVAEVGNVPGTTFTRSIVTPHDYLGSVSIGGLQMNGNELNSWNFGVFIVDDDTYSFKAQGYLSKKLTDYILMNGDAANGGLYLENGKVNVLHGWGEYEGDCTAADPYTYEYAVRQDAWMPQIGALFMYDNNYEYAGWFDCSVIVFTKSQLAEFKSSGKLPPMTNIWGSFDESNVDLSSHVDLTELKALLSSTQAPASSGKTASLTASTVYVNGTAKAFEAYIIDDNNYFKLRDLASVLSGTGKQFEVGYDEDTKAITLTSGNPYTAVGGEMAAGDGKAKDAIPTASKIYLDGRELNLTVYNISGNNFFKLRDLLQAIDVYVGYDNATKNITVDTGKGYAAE